MLDEKHLIKNRSDLKRYLECDRLALDKKTRKPRFMRDYTWRFQILLRKTEYWSNKKGMIPKFVFFIHLLMYRKRCRLNCVEIPINCIREGLTIWHLQNIIINEKCSIGYNFSISAGIVVGHAKDIIPIIGDNVMLMVNSSVLGARVCSNVAIGANSMVLKDITEEHTVWAGSPSSKISGNFPQNHEIKGDKIKMMLK